MVCPVCGAQNADGSQFCMNCGAQLTQAGQSPAGYGYGGQQPNYGAAPGAGQSQPGYGYGGQQPNYGAPQGAGQSQPGYGYGGQQPKYGAAPGASPAGYGYAGAPAATKKKNIVPIIAIVAVVAVAIVAVYFLFLRSDPIVGTWSYEESGVTIIFTFDKDGTGKITMKYGGESESQKMEWETSKGELEIKNTSTGAKLVYEYSIKNNKLTLTDPNDKDETIKMTREK